MDARLIMIEIAEKVGLVMTAGLVSVLVPWLRNRLLGVAGQQRDRLAAGLLGFCLAMWGAKMGTFWLGAHVNIHAVGVMMAAILGGGPVGLVVGLLSGLFYVYRVEPTLGMVGVMASTFEGAFAAWIVEKRPDWMQGWRCFGTTFTAEVLRFGFIAAALAIGGTGLSAFVDGWPAILVQAAGVASCVTIFVFTTRVVLAREEAAVALVETQAAADHLALEALRRRLEPHFLFNALNTLRATIRVDPAKARELVADLSDLYRYLLTHPQDAPLRDEVDHACAYLAIERARLGADRLEVEVDVTPEAEKAQVPALLLQPLVENAVKHGVGAHEDGGVVRIEGAVDGEVLRVCVIDRSSGAEIGKLDEGAGIALDTLRERLHKRFPSGASLVLEPREGGMCARVEVPWAAVSPQSSQERSAA